MTDRYLKLDHERWKNPTPRRLTDMLVWTMSQSGNPTTSVNGVRFVIGKVTSGQYRLLWLDGERWRNALSELFPDIESAKAAMAEAMTAVRTVRDASTDDVAARTQRLREMATPTGPPLTPPVAVPSSRVRKIVL